jgi:hypothetical protein
MRLPGVRPWPALEAAKDARDTAQTAHPKQIKFQDCLEPVCRLSTTNTVEMFISSMMNVRNRVRSAVKCGFSMFILLGILMSAFAQESTSFLVPLAPSRLNSPCYCLDVLHNQRAFHPLCPRATKLSRAPREAMPQLP